ncbi:hypothetical protein BDN72DRAFT_482265 [Pluteus cervinus]|uniref:Uncharacterized protein n=1 Tax=Pluteus cervinus TaxID=181527 RepID=A0ACD3B066_9AGAR|nr:hypothetical protein BDN72DRAFT_482265 [Pluteus cervinus]
MGRVWKRRLVLARASRSVNWCCGFSSLLNLGFFFVLSSILQKSPPHIFWLWFGIPSSSSSSHFFFAFLQHTLSPIRSRTTWTWHDDFLFFERWDRSNSSFFSSFFLLGFLNGTFG